MKRASALLTALAALVPSTALAHPGHGITTDPVLHLLSEPAHALPLIAVVAGALIFTFVRHGQKVKNR